MSESILTHKTTMKHHTCSMLEEMTISYIIAKETLTFHSKIWFSKHQNASATINGQILHRGIFQKQDKILTWVRVNRTSKMGETHAEWYKELQQWKNLIYSDFTIYGSHNWLRNLAVKTTKTYSHSHHEKWMN